jgi:hypothetical protein
MLGPSWRGWADSSMVVTARLRGGGYQCRLLGTAAVPRASLAVAG